MDLEILIAQTQGQIGYMMNQPWTVNSWLYIITIRFPSPASSAMWWWIKMIRPLNIRLNILVKDPGNGF
jgi:hypothetical protein